MFTRLCLAKCKGKIAFPDDAHVLLLALFTFVCVSVCEYVFSVRLCLSINICFGT